jgi:serine/threonine-protein kinase HipA
MKEASQQRAIEVWADWDGLSSPQQVGVLCASVSRGKEIFSFEYAPEWLQGTHGQDMDPALAFFSGQQYPSRERSNFGMFLDSAPDRWGRVLMLRREAQAARAEGRTRHHLYDADYLMGVYDGNRLGALRFRLEPDGPFVSQDAELASPPWTSLRELEYAADQIERPGAEKEPQYGHWIRMLVAPGGSLGGARPKAGVRDNAGRLWIAKFPSPRDTTDMGAWERLAHVLAGRAEVDTSPAQIRRFRAGGYHTFLTKRFDRTETGSRLHFASAMTLLNKTDGYDAENGASYLEMVELLVRQGMQTDRDLEQLWRRIVFFMCISNVDDHLRNHGFMLVPGQGWRLAPAYDMNPVEYGYGLKLNVSEAENLLDLDLAREVAEFFRVKTDKVREIIAAVAGAVNTWREVADSLGIPRAEQEQMEGAFRVAEGA